LKKVPAFVFFLLLFFKGLLGEEANILSNIRQLTFEGKRSGEGYFGPNGNLMVFQSEREPKNPFYQIYLMYWITKCLKSIYRKMLFQHMMD